MSNSFKSRRRSSSGNHTSIPYGNHRDYGNGDDYGTCSGSKAEKASRRIDKKRLRSIAKRVLNSEINGKELYRRELAPIKGVF